jgi:hypothetical protein
MHVVVDNSGSDPAATARTIVDKLGLGSVWARSDAVVGSTPVPPTLG